MISLKSPLVNFAKNQISAFPLYKRDFKPRRGPRGRKMRSSPQPDQDFLTYFAIIAVFSSMVAQVNSSSEKE